MHIKNYLVTKHKICIIPRQTYNRMEGEYGHKVPSFLAQKLLGEGCFL